MQELQYLFALMLGTPCKFVDPSAALDRLRCAFSSPEEQQVIRMVVPPTLIVIYKVGG